MHSDRTILLALVDGLEAAAESLRRSLANLPESQGRPHVGAGAQPTAQAAIGSAGGSPDPVKRARELHPSLGPRQAELIGLLAEAHPDWSTTGTLYPRMVGYGQANVYLTLKNMIPLGFVEKDASSTPHRYRLGPRLG